MLCERLLAFWYVLHYYDTLSCYLLPTTTGYDQGIMGSIISTPYFLEAINLKVGAINFREENQSS